MSDLTQRIAQLSVEERIILEERLLAARKNGHTQRIPRRADSGPAPLSFTQERLWFLAQLEPDSAAYNETQVLRLTGPLHIPALQRSLDALAARHDSLRVCFREIDGSLMQVAQPLPPTCINVIDLTLISADTQMDAAWQEIDSARSVIFDLTSPPLWRVFLIRLSDDDHIFVRIAHHIISDGWSGSIFWRELRHFYAAFAGGNEASPLPDLPVSYADYSVWQRERLQGERLAELVAYWRSRLAGVQPLHLPTDHPRPAQPSHRGAMVHFQLSQPLSDSLASLARASESSLYMLLLAAFQILLHRYSGQTDIAVGSPIANRGRAEIEGIYGFFVNTLVMRADCGGNPTFRSLLAQVRQNALAAYAHQELPFEKLVEEVHPVRDMRRNPLYDVMFALQNVPRADVGLTGTVMQRLERSATSSKFDLSLFLYERDGTLDGRLEYATDLFDAPTIQRMIGHFQTLLAGIVADPDSPIAELPLLTAAERQQILVAWNQTAADYPSDKTIHQLFAEQAERTPSATAIIDGERRLTYQELDESANRLAHHLLSLGVQPGEAVGICLERSILQVIGMLASLKAGAAWLPLDPSNPSERLAWMAQDAGMTKLISTSAWEGLFPETLFTRILLDQPELLAPDLPSTPPPIFTQPGDVAYYLYTSGSTGQPKGVMAPHRGTVNRMHWMWQQYPFAENEVVCQRTVTTFVDSVWETFGPLLGGSPIAIAPDSVVREPTAFVRFLAEHRISRVTVVPALLIHLLDVYAYQTDITAYPSLWVSSGEAISPPLVARFQRLLPQARLLNLYGSSEVAGDVTCWDVKSGTQDDCTVPLGRPIANTEIYVFDNHLQPLPIGIPGELYVGGAGLALGYLNRPDLTAERFLPHPFSNVPGARLYRTGDLARYREDGVIEFLGRVDRQVKIRGFRVEPGEIEAVLRLHPAVRDGVVGVLEDERVGKRLIAWWIGRPGVATDAATLRDFLRQRLPDYMLPAAFVPVAEFPLTPNGKIDLRGLPAPDFDTRPVASAPPQTPLETQLLSIWRRVLGLRSLGVDDNFFDAGGHSLLAVRLLAKVAKATGQELPVASLFYGPTIRQQAALIEQKGWSPPWTSLVPVQPGGSRPPLFLVPPAASTGLRFAYLTGFLGPDQPIYGFDPGGLDDRSQLHATIEEMAAHFVREMRQLQPEGPYLVGGMCFGGHVAYEMVQQLGEDAPVLLLLDVGQPANGPSWSLPPRNALYDWRRFLDYRRDGLHWTAVRRNLYSRWRKLWRRIRHWSDPDLQRMGKVYGMQLPAMRNYTARPTEAKLILFQSGESMAQIRQRGWQELSDRLEIIHFPNTTHRSLLLEDENVERIAEKLREVIDRWMAEHWQDSSQ